MALHAHLVWSSPRLDQALPQGLQTGTTSHCSRNLLSFPDASPLHLFLSHRPWNTAGVRASWYVAVVSLTVGSTLGRSEWVWDKMRSGEASVGWVGRHPHLLCDPFFVSAHTPGWGGSSAPTGPLSSHRCTQFPICEMEVRVSKLKFWSPLSRSSQSAGSVQCGTK